jgi:hypothetical protein
MYLVILSGPFPAAIFIVDKKDLNTILLLSHPSEHAESSTLVVIPDGKLQEAKAQALAEQLSDQFLPFLVVATLPAQNRVFEFTANLLSKLQEQKIKRATVCGFGGGATIAQALTVLEPKFVRRLILVNPTTRVSPGFASRFVDGLERMLPLGLPLRPLTDTFDSRPFLHRLRCPVLIVGQENSSDYLRQQSKFIATKVPNSWYKILARVQSEDGVLLSLEMRQLLAEFLSAPVKRPQKNNTQKNTNLRNSQRLASS